MAHCYPRTSAIADGSSTVISHPPAEMFPPLVNGATKESGSECYKGLIRATPAYNNALPNAETGAKAICVDAGMYLGARAYLEIALGRSVCNSNGGNKDQPIDLTVEGEGSVAPDNCPDTGDEQSAAVILAVEKHPSPVASAPGTEFTWTRRQL